MSRPRTPLVPLVSLALLLGMLRAAGLAAAPVTLELDARETQVFFSLGAVLHTVEGTIAVRRGTIRFDPATGAATGEIVLAADTAQTGNASRDADMHGKVLESAKYPDIVFNLVKVEGQFVPLGWSSLNLKGTVRLHGSTHLLLIPVKAETVGERVNATATFTVPYVAWGLHDPSKLVLRVDKEVTVRLHAVGRVKS